MATEYYSLEKLSTDLHQGITPIKAVDKESANTDFSEATVVEAASSEAEQANRTVDERDPDTKESKDRLNINKQPPQSTAWEREAKIDGKKKEVKSKKEEPKYPFNDADPVFAYYGNDKRTLLFFILRQQDGPQGQPGPTDTHQIHDNKEHRPAWYWVHKLLGQESIDRNTKREIDRVNKHRKQEEVADKDRMHKMDQEKLFQAKISAFEMDVIRTCKRRDMKSKIRRAKTIMELTAYVGAIIALEMKDGEAAN